MGFWLALIPPVILAYVEQGAGTALFVFLAYVLINGGVQNLVQPRLMGQSLNISPLVVFISVFVWAWLLGGSGKRCLEEAKAKNLSHSPERFLAGGSAIADWL